MTINIPMAISYDVAGPTGTSSGAEASSCLICNPMTHHRLHRVVPRCRCEEMSAKEAAKLRLACPVCAVTEGMASTMFSLTGTDLRDGGRGKRAWAKFVRDTLAASKSQKWRFPTAAQLGSLLHYKGSVYAGAQQPAPATSCAGPCPGAFQVL